MPRKRKEAGAAPVATETENQSAPATAVAERPAYIDGVPTTPDGSIVQANTDQPREERAKNWGDPYKPIFVSKDKGFELGENRRFKQRVFMFKEKPGEEILALLKENGFTYRMNEKAWTIHADADSRRMSDELARDFAGQGAGMSR